MKKAVIYARVSTPEQHLDNQVECLTAWAETKGLYIAKVYEETSSAWKDGHQKVLSQLLKDASRYRFDCVLVWSLDRLSREGVQTILRIIERLKRNGVRVLSLRERWTDVSGEMLEVLYSLVAWAADYESARLSEATRIGQARARRKGKHMGRPKGKQDSRKRHRRTKAELTAVRELANMFRAT